jgi:hypothetical protein
LRLAGTQKGLPQPNGYPIPQGRVYVISILPVVMASVVPIGIGCGGAGPWLGMQPPRLGTAP